MQITIDGFDIDVHPLVYNKLLEYQQAMENNYMHAKAYERKYEDLSDMVRTFKLKVETATVKPTKTFRKESYQARCRLFNMVHGVKQIELLSI